MVAPFAPFNGEDMFCQSTASPTGDAQIIVELLVNGGEELGCGIQAGSTTGSNTSSVAVVPAGATLSIEVISAPGLSGTVPPFDLLFGWRAAS
jgi:hypothetical protein